MGYVDNNLMTDEQVIYRTRLHHVVLFWPVVTLAIGSLLYRWEPSGASRFVTFVGIVATVVMFLRYVTSEFAVTDKRVIMKVGWIRRHTLETLLAKVENIGVDRSITGRLLGFGSVTVTGTGGTVAQFKHVRAPMALREHVQEQVAEAQDATHNELVESGTRPVLSEPRDERECPHCAELILVKAKVCKHCGGDVRHD